MIFPHKYCSPALQFFPFPLLSSLAHTDSYFPAMLSTFPAFLQGNSILANPFPDFETCFPPSNFNEPTSIFTLEEEPFVVGSPPLQELVGSKSGSETSNPTPVSSCSGSDDPNPNNYYNKRLLSSCNSYDANHLGSTIDERKRKRMISNRESARRSRMRKQKHLENTINQLNRLKIVKWEVANRLRLTVHQIKLILRENEHLRSESSVLRQRLWDLRQVLLFSELQRHLNP